MELYWQRMLLTTQRSSGLFMVEVSGCTQRETLIREGMTRKLTA